MKAVCISLDFELRWGVRHLYGGDFSRYKVALDGAKDAAMALCDSFQERKIASTWATVGALGLSDWDDFFSKITLDDLNRRSNFLASEEEFLRKNESYYFAPEVVKHICSSEHAELASHTFTHLFCCEPHVTEDLFLEDGELLNNVFRSKFGREVKSIVFPRNQENHMESLSRLGLTSYRAVEIGDTAEANTLAGNSLSRKVSRFSSAINPWVSHSSAFTEKYSRASLFLRLNLPRVTWQLHLARIRNELHNLQDGECFHLWMHPHNLGSDTNIKLRRIDQVINIILEFRDKRKVQILSMEELNEFAGKTQISHC